MHNRLHSDLLLRKRRVGAAQISAGPPGLEVVRMEAIVEESLRLAQMEAAMREARADRIDQ